MPTLLSQRNSEWKDELLGNGSGKIGGFGCTLTCLTMLANEKNVKDSNNRGKANGLFGGDTKNLILWTQIKKTFPNLDFVYRYYDYDNDKVLQAISDYGACLVEVDFDGTSRTDDRHWVLCVGNGKIHDPWTGTIRDFSVYPIKTGFTVIKVNKEESNQESNMIESAKKFFEKIKANIRAEVNSDPNNWSQNDIDNVSNEINTCYNDKTSLDNSKTVMQETLNTQEKLITQQVNQIASLNTKVEQDKADFEAFKKVSAEEKDALVKTAKDTLDKQAKDYEKKITALELTVFQLKTNINTVEVEKEYTLKELLIKLWEKIWERI